MGDLLTQLTRIIQNPTSNLTAAVLLLAALTLIVLIIIIALLLIVTRPPAGARRSAVPKKQRTEEEYEYPELSLEIAPRLPGEPSTQPVRRRARKYLAGSSSGWLVAVLVLLAAASGYVVSATEGYCRDACHGGDAGMTDKAMAQHKGVACVSCHEDGGPAGAAGALAQRTAHLVGQVVPNVHVYAAPVPSRRCLACHSRVRSRVITTSGEARMSHREPLEAGMACRDCHGDVGHEPVPRVPGMAKCVRCHDSKTASAACRSCHVKDTGRASALAGASRGFPRTQLGPVEDCGGCHDQASCDTCHGLRMPHTVEFKRWRHARSAAFERKEVCRRCHPKADCSKCHIEFPGHAPGWKELHKISAPRSKCECHWGKVPPEAQTAQGFCYLCH